MAQSAVQSVDRALRLLWTVHQRPGSTLSELAATVDLIPSTTLRLLATLERHELVERDAATKSYRIGPGATVIAGAVNAAHEHIRETLLPRLRLLAYAAREQASVGVLDGNSYLHIATVDGATPAGEDVILRPPGTRRHPNLNATGIGKVMLAHARPELAAELIGQLSFERTASRTITDADTLRRHLDIVRRTGYATSVDENTDHVRGIAVPIRDGSGQVVAALSVNGPTSRLPRSRLRELLPLVREAALDCSRLLGWDPSQTRR